jgi:hypothetical protein
MARQMTTRNVSPVIGAAEQWIWTCLVKDRSVFSADSLWISSLLDEIYQAFVEHPNYGDDDFMTKLKGQMNNASAPSKQLMAEMLWALLLFPSRMKPRTKRQQIREIWELSGQTLAEDHPMLADTVLVGIGSGGPGFNNYRPNELEFLISLVRDLKRKNKAERSHIFTSYDAFIEWIDSVPRKGSRQFRHMLRYFAFPDRVERISSNNDRRKILKAFDMGSSKDIEEWNDRQLDDKLMDLRTRLQATQPSAILDFYEPPLKEKWSGDRTIKIIDGEVPVTVPRDEDEIEDNNSTPTSVKSADARQSIQIQSKLAKIGAVMGFKVWIPRSDRGRVRELMPETEHGVLIEDLPLNYDNTTLDTIEQIDVIWLKRTSIARAFEVEHTTAVYSGLLRMADLLALQPNMDIRLHIVAPDERREKVFREMNRPVFALLEGRPLSSRCSFISYESVNVISDLKHLAHTNDSIIDEYQENSE